VLLVATLGQMTAKVTLYLTGAGVVSLSKRYEAKVDEYKIRFQKWEGRTDLLIFVSASLGFPPFLIVSPLAGFFRTGLLRFFLWGFLGRFLRFAAVFVVPRLIRNYWP
jgi:membrane protein YqaA with SNARE-associated domain